MTSHNRTAPLQLLAFFSTLAILACRMEIEPIEDDAIPTVPDESYGIPWNKSVSYGYFVDSRDGQGYYTVDIGGRTWMAQNLNYGDEANPLGVCYSRSSDSCAKYGRLYGASEVMAGASPSASNPSGVRGICPEGWHVPSDAEWQELEVAAGMVPAEAESANWRGAPVGMRLKSSVGWNGGGNGTDDFGFRILPGDCIHVYESRNAGKYGYFWSATRSAYSYHWLRSFSYESEKVARIDIARPLGFSLRCRRD